MQQFSLVLTNINVCMCLCYAGCKVIEQQHSKLVLKQEYLILLIGSIMVFMLLQIKGISNGK